MSKVFISYKRADKAKAAVIRAKLEALGVPLFIDEEIPATEHFGTAINERLQAASAVLVLWSQLSAKSPQPGEVNWVHAEAHYALDHHMFVGTCVEKLPPGTLGVPFNTLQAPDISDWFDAGAPASHRQWQHVLDAIGRLIKRPALAEFAIVLERDDLEAKRAFLRAHRDDPGAARFAEELETLVRTEFDEQMQKAQLRIDRRKTMAERKLAECKKEFERRLDDLRAGHHFMPPEPLHVLNDNVQMLQEKEVFLTRQLEEQRFRADEAESEVQQIIEKAGALDGELVATRAEGVEQARKIEALTLEVAAAKVASEKDRRAEGQPAAKPNPVVKSQHRSRPLMTSGVAMLGLVVGIVAAPSVRVGLGIQAGAVSDGQLDARERDIGARERALAKKQADLDGLQQRATTRESDLAKREAAVGMNETALKKRGDDLNRLQTDLAAAEERLRGRVAEADKAQAAPTRREQAVEQQEKAVALNDRTGSTAAPASQSARASECDAFAAYQFDPDRPKASGSQDQMTDIPVEKALAACSEALAAAGNDVLKRRLSVELGRVYAAQGTAQAKDDEAAAHRSFAKAVELWTAAAKLGSGQAYNLLGVYYQGNFAVAKPGGGRFEPLKPPNLALAWQNYLASAKLNNPTGLTNAGVVLIGLDESFGSNAPRDEAKGRQYLEMARASGFPRAAEKIDDAKRQGKGYPKDLSAGIN